MANETYTLIQTVTVGSGGAASISLSSIPQTFTDIQVVISGRSDSGLGTGNVAYNLAINGSTADKTFRRLYGGGGSAGSDTASTSARAASAIPTSGATASTFGSASWYFYNYASTTTYKSFSLDSVTENNSSSVYEIDMACLLWNSNAAINSLSFTLSDNSNFVQYTTAYVYGITKAAAPVAKATGGTVTYDAGYTYHAFTSSGTFTPTVALTADVLLVAGGGGASGVDTGGGGGGGGGVVYAASQSLAVGTGYTVSVGAAGGTYTQGSNSSFTGLTTAIGGGQGSSGSGGSGGGGTNGSGGGSGTAGQGYNGGSSLPSWPYGGGGGGGAGGAGGDVTYRYYGAAGGPGTSAYSNWAISTGTGKNGYFAGGGLGSGYDSGSSSSSQPANSGYGAESAWGTAGSGVIIVRYAN